MEWTFPQAKLIASAEANAEDRKTRVAITSPDTMISTLQAFLTRAQSLDTDTMGTDSTLKEHATSISATNTQTLSFTSIHISTAAAVVTQITVILVKAILMRSIIGLFVKEYFSTMKEVYNCNIFPLSIISFYFFTILLLIEMTSLR